MPVCPVESGDHHDSIKEIATDDVNGQKDTRFQGFFSNGFNSKNETVSRKDPPAVVLLSIFPKLRGHHDSVKEIAVDDVKWTKGQRWTIA